MKEPWNSEKCAEYLGVKKRYFMENIAPQVGFPQRRRYPTMTGLSRPQWDAQEVRDWYEKNSVYA